MKQVDWYDTPLYYDIIFDADTEVEVDFLEAIDEIHGSCSQERGRVLEMACGTARLARELSQRGWESFGFDANEAMLEFARLRLHQAKQSAVLWCDRMETFKVPDGKRFDLIHCLLSTFKYLSSESSALTCLQRASESLKKGGLLVIGLHLTDYSHPSITHERWAESRHGIEVTCNTRTWPANQRSRSERIRTRLRVNHPDGAIERQETHWVARTYSARQVKALLKRLPDLELVACYDFNHDPGRTRILDDSYSDVVLVLKRD